MESPIAEFLMRWLACELLPTLWAHLSAISMRKASQTYVFFSICCLIVYMGGLPVCAMKRTVYDRVHNWHWASAPLCITAFTA